jgi:hypothetical protein
VRSRRFVAHAGVPIDRSAESSRGATGSWSAAARAGGRAAATLLRPYALLDDIVSIALGSTLAQRAVRGAKTPPSAMTSMRRVRAPGLTWIAHAPGDRRQTP